MSDNQKLRKLEKRIEFLEKQHQDNIHVPIINVFVYGVFFGAFFVVMWLASQFLKLYQAAGVDTKLNVFIGVMSLAFTLGGGVVGYMIRGRRKK